MTNHNTFETIQSTTLPFKDDHPPRILIVNLMPNQFETELQFKRQLNEATIDFLYLKTHQTSPSKRQYVTRHYISFDEAKLNQYDGLIVTGAPVEHLPFNAVYYYDELKSILEWSKRQHHKRLFICWGAQFALHIEYQLEKQPFNNRQKLFGVYEYDVLEKHYLTQGFHTYHVPQSRYTYVDIQHIKQKTDLSILSSHPIYGVDLLVSKDNQDVYINGHLEYASNTLHTEYIRDCQKGINIHLPEHYYTHNNSNNLVIPRWQNFASHFFKRWISSLQQRNVEQIYYK
ncbi:homoserine O-succinyltransferase [Macrococcus capreoli]|uniref:homoserine O-succinyltransferase n=1 Tax=Macrococcus capreoli TaxID=2982690 RepID=UPI0021D5BD18|nr:homoserine O-succinyltransferase [Macrococcus sp. TMW 2.2395]MCU7556921.1 homoserine O-succinyltransferase [Macrococcus sp. TMW 2.2395]